MLRKIFKYDFNSIFRYWFPCALISLVVAVTAGLLGLMLDTMGDKYQTLNVLLSTVMVLCIIALIIFAISGLVFAMIRTNKSFFTDEAYLTFTLPVKKSSLISSKLINIVLFSAMSALLCIIDIITVFWICDSYELTRFLSDLCNGIGSFIANYTGLYTPIHVLMIVILSLVSSFMSSSVLMLCLSISSIIVKKHKILVAVVIYYFCNVVLTTLLSVMFFGNGFYQFIEKMLLMTKDALNLSFIMIMIAAVGISALIGLIFYMLTNLLFDKKLNVQ